MARYAEELRYSVVAHYTRALVYERIAPGLLEELERKSPPNEKGQRPNKLHQWLTEDVGNPLWFAKSKDVSRFRIPTVAIARVRAVNSSLGHSRVRRPQRFGRPKRIGAAILPDSSTRYSVKAIHDQQ